MSTAQNRIAGAPISGDVCEVPGWGHQLPYDGWYVLEQDTILTEEAPGEGLVADVNTSAAYPRRVISSSG